MTAPPVIVLAAGSASRFGSDKLLAEAAGRSILRWTLDTVLASADSGSVLVVTGPPHEARRRACGEAGVAAIVAGDAARGMRWSLDAGLRAVDPSCGGAVVVLGDDPLAARALADVLAAATEDPHRAVAVRRTPFVPHPVYLPRACWPPPPRRDEDHGLRELLGPSCRWLVHAGVAPRDVDEPTDLAALAAALSAPG